MQRILLRMLVPLTVVGLCVFTVRHFSHTDTQTYTDVVSNGDDASLVSTYSSTTPDTLFVAGATVHVPIAVYHSIRNTSPDETLEVRRFTIPPAVFDEQMHYLYENNFHPITFAMLYEALTYGTPLPLKPVILSFDDGWATQYIEALPVLQKYDFTATFFLYPNVIEHENYMTWDEVRVLHEAGMEIGSHSKSHQYMTRQDAEEQMFEVTQSKKILEEKLDSKVETFAYPYGLFNADMQDMLKDAGYTTARGLDTGVTHSQESLYELPSYLIRNDFNDFKYFVNQTEK